MRNALLSLAVMLVVVWIVWVVAVPPHPGILTTSILAAILSAVATLRYGYLRVKRARELELLHFIQAYTWPVEMAKAMAEQIPVMILMVNQGLLKGAYWLDRKLNKKQ